MDFNKLTIKSQEAVAAAQECARRLGNPELYPEHLLLALLDQELPKALVDSPDELRASADQEISYEVTVPLDLERDRVTTAILRLDPEGHAAVDWSEKKNKAK